MIMDDDGNVLPHHLEARARERHDTDGEHFYLDGICAICEAHRPSLYHSAVAPVRTQLLALGFEISEADDDYEIWSRPFPTGEDGVYLDLRLSVVLP